MIKRYKKFRSLNDLRERCEAGDVRAQQICIGALENLGCEHLASTHPKDKPKWYKHWQGLLEYVTALVAECGVREDKAFRDVIAEVNNVIDCCEDVQG